MDRGVRPSGSALVQVDSLVFFVGERLGHAPGLEGELDRAVKRLGGRRRELSSSRWGRWLRRLTGWAEPLRFGIYELPAEFLERDEGRASSPGG